MGSPIIPLLYPTVTSVAPKELIFADEFSVAEETGIHVCEAASEYRCRRSEDNPLYGVVSGYLETYLAMQSERERIVTRFVERELRAFLDCGVPANGFLRVHCDTCGKDRVVAFSC